MKTPIPTKTNVSDLVNTKFTNTLDFHISSTNFVNIVKDYGNYLSLYLYYRSKDCVENGKYEFFKELCDGINLKNISTNKHTSSYLSKAKIKLKQNEQLFLINNQPVSRFSNEGVLQFKTIDQNGNTRFIDVTKNSTNEVRDILSTISTNFSVQDILDEQFITYWRKQFDKLSNDLKEQLKNNFNLDTTILGEFSDSIASVLNGVNYLRNNDLPLYDAYFTVKKPYDINQKLDEKINIKYRKMYTQLNLTTESLYRRNISQCIENTALPIHPHKTNLVTDIYHPIRLVNMSGILLQEVGTVLGDLFRYYIYTSNQNIVNQQKVLPLTVEQVVENNILQIDSLNEQIKNLNILTSTSLGV